ncbi:hypothetical protein [Glacieibacterium frigidum]|uniref:Uncharacterized protein n=1 Tax=Glacieibacterium frigidum TaxID=2593303 RepID=A0A552UGN9_9SPHN|nr:hypothetical protein [Glacieibacterium frigidum]TRW17351.1 hypothetical protein FMM06_04030 [Glacieibacterium frigidum]
MSVAGCDAAGGAAGAAPPAVVRPTIAVRDGAPVVLVGGQVVLTAAQAEEAARFRVGAQADIPTGQVYLIEAPSGGSACPMRYVVVTVKAGRGVATPPFGTCSSRAALKAQDGKVVVTMPGFSNIGAPGPARTFRLQGDRMTATDETSPQPATTTAPLAYAPTFRCEGLVDAAAADAMLAKFEAEYPKPLVSPALVEGQRIAPATLTRIVTDLSCLAAQIGGDPFVPEQAAALFASRRHGADAFAALDRLAVSDEQAARFRDQMKAYIAAR